MEFKKIYTHELEACYALERIQNDTSDYILVASELDKPCYAFDLNNNFEKIDVWPNIGGTMTIVHIPGTLNFLATQCFYPGFNSLNCRIVKGSFNGHDWDIKFIADFPYLHRFDLVDLGDDRYHFIGCTIANSKKDSEDWNDPGKIFVGIYDDTESTLKDIQTLKTRITMNHGYRSVKEHGFSLITGKEGIFKLAYPKADERDSEWKVTKIFSQETSDIAYTDINGDGEDEYLIIQGFHGDELKLYDYSFKTNFYTYSQKTPFGHAIWGGKLMGEPHFIFGYRSGSGNLFSLLMTPEGKIVEQMIERHVGPSNILIFNKDGKQFLASANHAVNEFAVYEITNGGMEE